MRKEELSGPDVFVVHGFLSADECRYLIVQSEAAGYGDAPITTFAGPVIRKDVRNNDRFMVDDEPLARDFWERAKPFIPERFGNWAAVGLNERFRYYRYDVGQKFDWHFDGAFERGPGEQSHLTFMVYLNDDFEGGATAFDFRYANVRKDAEPLLVVKPETGKLLVFRHRVRHTGREVTAGRKYVVRSDVMYRWAEPPETSA